MSVTRILESPRVTWPYTDQSWSAIEALGHAVDADLAAMDVRLTMGGEPTFVAADDRDGAEWNTTALGPNKRAYATELVQRLREKYGAGGFLHFGQGKWYPGEPLPRWSLSVYWRRDGQWSWRDPSRFADERVPHGYGLDDARRLMLALVDRLGLDPRYAIAAYEDVWYYLWRERSLPINVDPFDSRLDDDLERARLQRIFDHGLSSVVGYALPLRRADDGSQPRLEGAVWQSGPWFFRDERMYLVPGDSPMGWRLPLDSLPWATEADRLLEGERDPFAARPELPDAARLQAQYRTPDRPARAASATPGLGPQVREEQAPARFASAAAFTRTALCVEARGGNLYVFMPPLAQLEDYLELLAAIEATVAELNMAIVLEGYPPPRDARLVGLQGYARSWCHRGQHPPLGRLGRTRRPDRAPLRGSALFAPVGREVYARRPSHRHRRWQPFRTGRRDPGRQPLAAAP